MAGKSLSNMAFLMVLRRMGAMSFRRRSNKSDQL
jgi:hypothetical protein